MLFEKYWGNAFIDYSFRKLDALPRLTATVDNIRHPRAYMFQVGFIFFTLQITIWSRAMREVLKKEKKSK